MIEHEQEANHWEFLFLGANMDAVTEAGKLGIQADRAATYVNDSQGVGATFASVSAAVGVMRRANPSNRVGSEWKEEVERDQKSRK